MATLPNVADAIVTVLNNAALSQTFTAVRLYRPVTELKDFSGIKVTVVPKDQVLTLADRAQGLTEFRIDIGVQKKLTTASNAEIDEMMELVEEILDLIRLTVSFGIAKWLRTENELIYSPDHLDEMRVFTSILTLTLRAFV